MAGILAWAADVVGGAGASDDEADDARAAASAAMTPDQRLRAADLDARAASLRRVIQDLRLRVPPPHVAQRLPHLHAHSLASSAALVLQLNAHSSTKEQYQGGCSVLFRWLTTPEEDHRRMIRHVWADDEGHFNQNHNDWDSFPFYGRSIYNLRAELGVLEPEGNIPGIAICVRPGWIGRLTLCSPTCLEAKTLGHRRPHHRVAR